MNCKPGDLAVCLRSAKPEFIGRIVTVTRMNHFWPGYWESEPVVRLADGRPVVWADKDMRPIRPSEGQDETLSWKSLPTNEGVPA